MKKPNVTHIPASRTLHNITYIFIGAPLTIFVIWINQKGFLYADKYV